MLGIVLKPFTSCFSKYHSSDSQPWQNNSQHNIEPVLIRRRFPEQQNRDDGCCEATLSDAVLARFRRSPPESTRMAALECCDAQSGANKPTSDGGVEGEAEAPACLLC